MGKLPKDRRGRSNVSVSEHEVSAVAAKQKPSSSASMSPFLYSPEIASRICSGDGSLLPRVCDINFITRECKRS